MKLLFELEHTFLSLLMLAIGWSLGYPLLFVWASAIFFIGREHAQAEYRYIEHYSSGLRANMPWWATLTKRSWDFHSLFYNLFLPIYLSTISSLLL
jgi:hypothetical protein